MLRHPIRLALLLSTLALGACADPAKDCCDCIVSQGCWDYELCPEDPMGSCMWVRGDGELPAYANDGWDVCLSVYTVCEQSRCSAECADLPANR